MSALNPASTDGTATTDEPVDDRALPAQNPVLAWLKTRSAWVLGLDIVLILVFTLLSRNHVFWSLDSARALLIGGTEALLLALGLAMMLGAGIFDLSVGANLVLSSTVGALVMKGQLGDPVAPGAYESIAWPIAAGLIACLITGMLYGLVNGLLIAIANVNSLIATLGTLGIGTGIALLISKGSDVAGLPSQLQTGFGLKAVFDVVPMPALIAVAATIVLWVVVRYTRFGMHTLAIGSSRAAAERAGLRVKQHLIALTMLGGLLAGTAGFIDLSRFGSTALAGHGNDALAAVTAVVIGGTLLEGGYISISGTVWGAALAVILQSGLVIVGVSSFWQLIVVGAVLLIAVMLDRFSSKRVKTGFR